MPTPATLERSDTGATLVIDGLITSAIVRDVAVTVHPTQDQGTVTDNAQPRPLGLRLTVIFGERPLLAGIQSGPQRMQEVLGFLEGVSKGVALNYTEQGMPVRRSMRMTGYQFDRNRPELRGSISLLEVTTATSRTVELDRERAPTRARTPRADVAAGRSGTQDRGAQPTKRAPTSAARAAVRLVTGD
jgi:hypothetical protein